MRMTFEIAYAQRAIRLHHFSREPCQAIAKNIPLDA